MIKLSRACVGVEEEIEILKVMRETVNFGLGVHVSEFEKDVGKYLDSKNPPEVICVNTGTAALHMALEGMGFPKGSEVLVPTITFLASFSAVSAAGLVPVAVDVTLPSCHISVDDCKSKLTKNTVAIMPVAYTGVDFDRKAIYAFAQAHNLRVIEDDAHAFGGEIEEGVNFGASGDVVCFSFDGIKNITCGEGGAIVTRNKEYAYKLRVLRSLGIEGDVELRYQGGRAWEYNVSTQGFRYHMSNLNAAMGIAQLRKIDFFTARRRELVKTYLEALKEKNLVQHLAPTQIFSERVVYHIFPCILNGNFKRSEIRTKLKELGVETGVHYLPNHLHEMYRTEYRLPNAESVGGKLLSLPLHANLTKDDIWTVCDKISSLF